jgi:hypothetical protein
MNRETYIGLMKFPSEWSEWEMLPGDIIDLQISEYRPGQESASEHARHGVFQWWIRMGATEKQLVSLARLSWIDPDPPMGNYVRECMAKFGTQSTAVADAIASPYHRA